MAKAETVQSKWYVVDAEGMVLGRLASQVAAILRGKNKPTFTPHVDTGDHVIILNADKVVLTGDIAAGTACKITYDKKGLVTKGEALVASDIPTIPVDKVSGVLPVDQTPIMAVTKDVSAATAGTAVAIASGMTTALIAQVFDSDGNVVFCQTAITGGTVSLTLQ